jgi:DNA-binding CsgD family transcriptional regulator
MRPALIAERGLGEAVKALVARSPLPATAEVKLDGALPGAVETAAYYVVARGCRCSSSPSTSSAPSPPSCWPGQGGVGYLLKDRVADPRDFVDAVRRVAGGGTALDPEAVAQLTGGRSADGPLADLTPREREVLGLMAEGRSNAAIARELVVTAGAVEKHISSIFGKLRLPPSDADHRRVLAVLAWLREG